MARKALGTFEELVGDDRNLTVHTYGETLANAIYSRLAGHAALLDRWLKGMGAVG